MKKVGIIVGIVVALIIVALLAIPAFVNVNQYRGKIEAELQKQLKRPVTLGEMHLRLLPPSVRIDGFSVGENPAFGTGKFATAQQLYVRAKFWPLLRGSVQISSLDLRQPVIQLIRNAQGTWNFSTLGTQSLAQTTSTQQAPQKPQPAPSQPAPGSAQQSSQFSLDNVSITDGTIKVIDGTQSPSQAVYDHIDATLNNYAPNQPFTFTVAANLPGKGNQAIRLSGKAGPVDEANAIQTPFSGTLKLNNVQLAGLAKYLNTAALANTDAVVTGTTDINNEQGKLSSRGSIKLQDARIHGVDIGYPITADYRFTDDLSSEVINIDKGNIELGSTPLSVTGTLNTKPTPSQVNVHLKAADVSIGEAARLASAFGIAFNPNTKVEGRVNADITATGPMTQPAMNGSLTGRNLIISGADVPQPVKIQAVDLNLTPQQVRSNPFTAVSGSTSVGVQFTLAQYTTASPMIDAQLKTANAQISELLGMARAYGISAVNGMSGSGNLNLDVHATGPMKNPNAMKFNGAGAISNATLKPPSFTQPLGIRNANIRFTSNSAVMSNLAASLGSTNASGNLTIRNFAAPNLQFALNADVVNVTQLQQITGGSAPVQPNQRASAGWNILPVVYAQTPPRPAASSSILPRVSGNGNITIGTLQDDQLVLKNVRSAVNINRGLVKLAPIAAALYNGQATGDITANLLTTPMQVLVNTKLANVSANDLLSSVSSLKNTLYGLLAANADLHFNAASSSDIARTLNGTLALNLTNGKITTVDIVNQLAAIGKFVGLRKSATAMTNIAKLSGNFNITNGVAQTNNLQAAIDGGTLAAAGVVNLASQALDLHLTAVLDKNVTQQAGGNTIGGLMQTALQNNRGELVMPVLVTGTFQNPHFEPDLQKLAQMKLNNALPTLANPGGAAGTILGSLLNGKGQGQNGVGGAIGGVLGALSGQQQQQPSAGQQKSQQNTQQQQPANTVNELLNSVLGGSKKKQQQKPAQQPPPRQ